MKKLFTNLWLHFIVGGILLLFLFVKPSLYNVNHFSFKKFNTTLQKKEKIAVKELDKLIAIPDIANEFTSKNDYSTLSKSGITFYVFKDKTPVFWTSRTSAFSNDFKEFKTNNGIVILQNGWYQYLLKKQHQTTYLALILIKHQFSIENKFLKNKFHGSFHVPENTEISLQKKNNGVAIKSLDGTNLFYLTYEKEHNHQSKSDWVIVIVFFAGLLFLLSFLSKLHRKIIALRKIASPLVILFIGILWGFLYYFNLPNILFQQELFSPNIYAHSLLLPSLGHFLILVIFLILIVYHLNKWSKNINANNKIIAIFTILITAILPLLFSNSLEGLVKNSTLIFDTNYLFDLTAYSFIGLFGIILLFVTFIIFIQLVITTFSNKAFHDYQLTILLVISSILAIIIGYHFFDTHLILSIWSIAYILISSSFQKSKNAFYKSITVIILAAFTLSYGFIHFGEEKEVLKKEFLAKKLSKEKDPIAEYLFEELTTKIEADTSIIKHIDSYLDHKINTDKYIIDKYFGGYWNHYNINIIGTCQQTDSIYIEDDELNVGCLSFFKEKIEKETDNPFNIDKHFNFLYSSEGVSSYIAQLKLQTNSNYPTYLFIEFFPKDFSKTEGYPELLLNQKEIENVVDFDHYSYAKYKKGKLVDNSGNYDYSLLLDNNYQFDDAGYLSLKQEGFNHLIYHSDKNTTVIISAPQKTIFNYITTFSYLFLIAFIMVLAIGLLMKLAPFNWQVAYTDFSTKIQLFIIASIFLSFILFGWGTSYYIEKQNLDKNKKSITEKVQSVLIELEHKLGNENNLTPAFYDEMTYYLVKFSNVFYTDINLYDKNGLLLASSRPEIFNTGLVNKTMEPDAYRQLNFEKKSAFIHQENIGGLNYLSAYVPFRNEKNKILAYMNLPYFAKQNELENDLSEFFTALLNVYGLLFLISVVIAVFFANYISEPLRMIKDRISALQLGKSYEQIDWQSNDEIGSLVLEYNKKVLELENSAQLLIKSERESAWREMAKQVAHEIKNPLTPMKLGIQQLQRVANDNPADLKERIDRTAKTLIEQIETLTNIANEFSSFAKMPKANEAVVDLIPKLETTIDLFSKEDCSFLFNKNALETAKVVADKDQLSRVFNNIIKNALQAIPETQEGKIELTIKSENENYLITIKDNGDGIPDDKKDKIFMPSFTTKSTGMGLGLVIVKNIIEAANGKIWFETKEGIGTTFFIELPKTH